MRESPDARLQEAALASVANAVMITDTDGTIVWVNEAFTRMSGYGFDEAVGSTPRLLKSGKHGEDHYGRLWATILAGRTWRGEVVDRRKDGQLYTVFQTITPILGDGGAPTHFVAVHEDVSDLRSSQARLQALYDHAADAIVLFDADGRVVEANPAACALTGRDSEGLVDTPLPELLKEPRGTEFARAWTRFVREGRWRGRTILRRPDGTEAALTYQAVADIAPGLHLLIAQDETAQRAAEERQRFQAHLLDAVGDAVVAADVEGVVRYWNPAAERLYGWSHEDAIGRDVTELIVPVHEQEQAAGILAQVQTGEVWSGELTLQRRDGGTVQAWVTAAPYHDAQGELAGVIGVATDISEFKRTHALLAQRVREHEAVAGFARETLASANPRELAARAEALVVETLGEEVEAAVIWGAEAGNPGAEGASHDVGEVRVAIGETGALVLRAPEDALPDTSQRHFLDTVAHILDTAVQRDATDAQLQHLATHDPVTGLPNRVLLLDRIAQAGAASERSGGRFVLVCLDFDGFKFVNDALGRDTGDEVLTQLAHRLKGAVRPTDTVARIGGDEFAVLCPHVRAEDEAYQIAARVRSVFTSPLRASGNEVTLTASIGVVVGDGRSNPVALLRDADAAMHWAKEAGRNRIERFDQRMQHHAVHRIDVTSALRHALDHGAVEVRYQPCYELATGRLAGAEALARIPVPGDKTLSPDQFIWVAEDAGLIAELDEAVLTRACADAAAWLRADPGFMLGVNLSPHELTHPDLIGNIERTLTETGVPAGALWLELTESALLSGPGVYTVLHQLRELGVHLAIDDFGTGYSSLAHLRHVPAEMLKIDRSFVANLTTDAKDRALITAALDLAEAFGLSTTGEGIETAEHRDHLAELGCEYGQGFLWSRPVEASALTSLTEPPWPRH